MQVLLLFPLAFLAGMDGFAIFAPYLVLIVLLGHLLQKRRRAAAARSVAVHQQKFIIAASNRPAPSLPAED
jgi:hypothetical protein